MVAERRAVALIAYDICYPAPLSLVRPIGAAFGVALVLAPAATETAVAGLEIRLRPGGQASVMASPELEALRCGTPAARSLPLLAALARRAGGGCAAGLSGRHGAGRDGLAVLIGMEQIEAMIPHAGEMCLLDEVLSWDEQSVRCVSRRYGGPKNPMRRANGGLGAACGIEIAAQAMAVHGRLVAQPGGRPSIGYLASLRDVRLNVAQLDSEPGDLIVEVERLMGDADGAAYRFSLTRGGAQLLSGRATVLLAVPA